MSSWFTNRADAVRLDETFQLTEVPHVDAEKFEPIERAAIERLVTEQQGSLVRLQSDVLEMRAERTALERQLSTLESERGRLQERIGELEATRPSLEPTAVFSNLGAALQEVDEDLKGERYRVDDVDFRLKTNVIQTDEGLRMHLPSLDESSASANLSEVSFRLRAPRGETDAEQPSYVDVPDLRGVPYEVAARRLASAELTVGTVERAVDPDTTPGTVIEQFPDAFSVAEAEAPIDLVIAADPDPGPDGRTAERETTNETEGSQDESRTDTRERAPRSGGDASEDDAPTADDDERNQAEPFRRAIAEVAPEHGKAVVDRLRRAGVTDPESLRRFDPDELAARLSIPTEVVDELQAELGGKRDPVPLEEVSGIGPTYAGRLRDAGVHGVSQLATLDPGTVSDLARVSTGRAEEWIEQARRLSGES
ncbi:helix-hairpin-helix domain-containing protein [Halorubrum tibetense]|uniref:Helix-hairpin-helix domain-containing protein n=1 Tax=Halorubrum tibetense TaxID=175631 RepID=A0ABD5SAS4_9EURY